MINWLRSLVLAVGIITLAACGGGGSGTSGGGGSAETLSGTVAAGAPLIGFVAARDSTGNTVAANINDDGSYSLDVSELEAPYLIYASGLSGGAAYVILSAATSFDINGTVNVTPLTDLIIANVAGDNPTAFFNNPDFSLLTDEAISAAQMQLRDRLASLLGAIGLDAAEVDLRTTAFTTNRTGLDALLDVLEITIAEGVATIRNRITNAEITNTFATVEDTELVTDDGAVSAALTANSEIANRINMMISLFNNDNVPDFATLSDYLTSDFLTNGINLTLLEAFVGFAQNDADTAADLREFFSSFKNYALVDIDLQGNTASVDVGFSSGALEFLKTDNIWKLRGNQRLWDAIVTTEYHYDINGEGGNSRLHFLAEFMQAVDVGSIQSISVTGPGLAGGSILLDTEFLGIEDELRFEIGQALSNEQIDTIPNGTIYTFTAYNDVDGLGDVVNTYTARLMARPVKSGELNHSALPQITTPTVGALDTFTLGNLNVTWTLPAGYRSDSVVLDRHSLNDVYLREAEAWVSRSDTSSILTVESAADQSTISRKVIVFTKDSLGRTIAPSVVTSP